MTILLILALQSDPRELIEKLGHKDVDVRDRADAELRKRGADEEGAKKLRPILEAALKDADREVAARVQAILESFPKLKLIVTSNAKTHKAGDKLDLRIRIRNVSPAKVRVVGSLDGSCTGSRFPRYTAQILDGTGAECKLDFGRRCGNTNALREKDFVELAPGEEFDPYRKVDDYGFFGHDALSGWTIPNTGTYTLVFTADFSEADAGKWGGWGSPEPMDAKLQERLAGVPKVKLVAKLEFTAE